MAPIRVSRTTAVRLGDGLRKPACPCSQARTFWMEPRGALASHSAFYKIVPASAARGGNGKRRVQRHDRGPNCRDEPDGDDFMRDREHAYPSHPYRMYGAIHAQPSAIYRVLEEEGESTGRLARRAESTGRVHLVGIGTSWHAALVGEHLLCTVGGLGNVRAWNSFEFNAYRPELGARDLVIVLSHRGTKRYSALALATARSAGAVTAVVTGIGSAVDADLADIVV